MKEAALPALIRQKHQARQEGADNNNDNDELGSHVRGIKDLKPARFCWHEDKVAIPATNEEMSGKIPDNGDCSRQDGRGRA